MSRANRALLGERKNFARRVRRNRTESIRRLQRVLSLAEEQKQDLLQLYRFCFLMLADATKAQEIFHATLREAAQLAANGEAPRDRLWFFRNARWRCLEVSEQGLQAEDVDLDEGDLAES